MAAASIDDLLEEFGTKPFTLVDFRREKALLERRFMMTYGIHAVDIDDVVDDVVILGLDATEQVIVDRTTENLKDHTSGPH